MRSLLEFTHSERIREQASSQVVAYDNGTTQTPNVSATQNISISSDRNASLNVKYPPLPKWMEKLPSAHGSGNIARGGNGIYNTDGVGDRKFSGGLGVRRTSWMKRVVSLRKLRRNGMAVRAESIPERAGSRNRASVVRRVSILKWMQRLPKTTSNASIGAGAGGSRHTNETSRGQSSMPKWMEKLPQNRVKVKE